MYPRRAPVITETEAELLDEARATWVEVMRDPSEPALNRMVAAEKLRNDIAGTPVQRVVTPASDPTWFVIEGQAEVVSSKEWEQQAKLALAKPEGSAD